MDIWSRPLYCKPTGWESIDYLKQDIGKLSTRRASKMIRGFGTLAYNERMTRYGFPNLGKRRTNRGELIEAYKIVTRKKANIVAQHVRNQYRKHS